MRRIDFRLSKKERVTYLVCSPFFIAAFAFVLFALDDLVGFPFSLSDRIWRAFIDEVFVMIEAILILGYLRCIFTIKWLDRAVQWAFDHMLAFYICLVTLGSVGMVIIVYFVLIPESLANATR